MDRARRETARFDLASYSAFDRLENSGSRSNCQQAQGRTGKSRRLNSCTVPVCMFCVLLAQGERDEEGTTLIARIDTTSPSQTLGEVFLCDYHLVRALHYR